MSVSVIIPFWNGGQWIERAVVSVVNQTAPPDEFFVVNDGSAPEERAYLAVLAEQHGFVILDKENGGQGSARNHGVLHSSSQYICFLDQDDFFLPDHLERLCDLVVGRGENFGFGYGSYDLADAHGVVHVKNDLVRNQRRLHPPSRDLIELVGRNLSILPSASIISKRAFMAVEGFDVQFRGYEDDDLCLRLFRSGKPDGLGVGLALSHAAIEQLGNGWLHQWTVKSATDPQHNTTRPSGFERYLDL